MRVVGAESVVEAREAGNVGDGGGGRECGGGEEVRERGPQLGGCELRVAPGAAVDVAVGR